MAKTKTVFGVYFVWVDNRTKVRPGWYAERTRSVYVFPPQLPFTRKWLVSVNYQGMCKVRCNSEQQALIAASVLARGKQLMPFIHC